MFNHSPWPDYERPASSSPKTDVDCDVAIVGAGISGVSTLYYLLTTTEKKVALFERDKVASGATGHNAGLAVVHIEKPAAELVEVIGEEATRAIFSELDEAWDHLHEIHEEIGLRDNLLSFSHAINGFNSMPQFLSYLESTLIRNDWSRTDWRFLVSENLKGDVPEEYLTTVEFVPQETILKELKTIDSSYIAAMMRTSPFKGKRMNSAKFCYKVLDFLKEKFPGRFSVYEHTDITQIDLYKNHSVLRHTQGNVKAQDVVLCTNAYKHFAIWDVEKKRPVTKLQDSITPRIGYLAAFPGSSPERYAMGFVNRHESFKDVPFWYFSHAPCASHNPNHSCVIGGPEFDQEEGDSAEWVEANRVLSFDLIKRFLNATFEDAPTEFAYFWYGWMGYTPDGLRWVGPDSDHPHLWYNLACNGIGIVPAIAGAKRVADLMLTK